MAKLPMITNKEGIAIVQYDKPDIVITSLLNDDVISTSNGLDLPEIPIGSW